LRGIQRCLKENVYDYRLNPEFDPMFDQPDPEIPTLAEALLREKEDRMRLFRRDQADKDRERMPPPPIPQTPSTSDESNSPQFPNGQSNSMVNNGSASKGETVNEKKYGCTVEGCPKSYKNLQGLKNHVKKEHPGVSLPSKLSHSEESILATALGGNAPPRLPPPPVNQRLPQLPPPQQQRSRTPQQQQQQQPSQQQHVTGSSSRPLTPQQPQTPTAQHRYEMQQQPPMTPQTPQHPPQQQQYIRSPHQQQQQIHHQQSQQQHTPQQQPMQQQMQYAQVTIPVSQAYPQQQQSQQMQQQSQGLLPQQQQARLPAPPTQIYQQQSVMESPQSVPSEYSSAVASPISVVSQESVDEATMAQHGIIQGGVRKVLAKPQVTMQPKMKCPHCTKSYKTHQNLQKHVRDVHPQMVSEVEVSYAKTQQQTTTYYAPAQNVNRQDVLYIEQQQMGGNDPNIQQQQQQEGRSVTIVRQQPQMHITDDQQQQHIPQNQIVTSQAGGQTIVHYQVQQVPIRQQHQQQQQIHHHPQQQQQQIQPMEIDPSQQQQMQQHQQQQTYSSQGPSPPDVIMIDSTPPATPRMTPVVSSIDQQPQQHQQVYIQTSNGQLRPATPGQQIIRQQGGRSVLYQSSQPIHIIQQQPFSGEKFTTVLVRPSQQYRTVNPQQISRNGQQIISNQQGNTYAYPVTQSNQGIASRYYTTGPQRPSNPQSNQSQNPSTPSSTNNPSVESGTGGEQTSSNDYYSTPPQLTPQQAIPRPRQPQGAYKVYSQGRGISQVRTVAIANSGSKGTVKYAVQVPQGNYPSQTYVNQSNIQYVRAPGGNVPKGSQVQFITNPVRVTNPQRPGQSMQQYPVAVTGQPVAFSSRPQQPYTVRGQNQPRGRIVVPAVQGTPRRPQKPVTQVHQQQQQQIQGGGSQEGQIIQIQRLPALPPSQASSQQQIPQTQSQQIPQPSQMDTTQSQPNPE
jgi:hypothetical protein